VAYCSCTEVHSDIYSAVAASSKSRLVTSLIRKRIVRKTTQARQARHGTARHGDFNLINKICRSGLPLSTLAAKFLRQLAPTISSSPSLNTVIIQTIKVMLLLNLVLLLGSLVWLAGAEESAPSNVARVAFVFAGSARSFVYSPIHLSIKYNLIDAFCPPGSCHAEVFALISISDNTHIGAGANANGKFIAADKEKEQLTHTAIKRLHDNVHYEVIDIGSPEENARMDSLSRNNTMHKIYRDLDPRRYNMYYNRWASYQKAVEFESLSGLKFDWVIHSRLDFFWGTPVRPCHEWSPNRLWVMDQWATDIADPFAVLSRKWSDMYYSIDALYADRRVGCLGGPNLDPNTVTEAALRRRGYSNDEIKIAIEELCTEKFKDAHHVKSEGVEWSWAGVSEIMLKRKLQVNDVHLGAKTLGFTSVLGVMVRDPLELFCHYATVGSFIAWAREYHNPTSAFHPLCETMKIEFNRAKALSTTYGPNCNDDPLVPAAKITDTPLSACLLDPQVTDWNFMPFRIRGHQNDCATAEGNKLVFGACEDTSESEGYVADYNRMQLFHFYPLSTIPQNIKHREQCITVHAATVAQLPRAGHAKIAVHLGPCHRNPAQGDVTQQFRVRRMDYNDAVANRAVAPISSNLSSVVPQGNLVRKQYLPDISAVELRWLGHGEQYCLAHRGHILSTEAPPPSASNLHEHQNLHLFLTPCEQVGSLAAPSPEGSQHTAPSSHLFVIERTIVKSPINY
jgi:hypothetical protein